MDLNSTHYFVQVVQAGSFAQASRMLHVPKSTLSDKVSELEEELGVALLTRTTRKLSLTEAGENFYKKIRPALLEIDQARDETSGLQTAVRGRLRITAVAGLEATSIVDVLVKFRKKYPEIKLDLLFTDRVVDLVGEGFDIAIRGGTLEDSTLISKKIGTSSFGLFANPKYIKENGVPRYPKDLEKHSCIHFTALGPEPIWELESEAGKKAKIEISGSASANSVASLKRLVELGEGIALLPIFHGKKENGRGALVRVLPDWTTESMPVHLVYPKQKHVNPRIREVIPYLEEGLRELSLI
ncbi:MAG: LysR family transcriptional regulator [Bdellovibrionia bacterium]